MVRWHHHETQEEYAMDSLLGLAFFILCVWSVWRLITALPSLSRSMDRSGGARVIAVFYLLIFTTSTLRCIWFFIPSDVLEGSYVPVAKVAYETRNWVGVFTSEVLLSLGNMSLYSIFILIAAFWAHMLRRVDSVDEINVPDSDGMGVNFDSDHPDEERDSPVRKGPLWNFGFMMATLFMTQGANFVLFLFQFYDSDGMILFDSILLCIVSLATLIEFTIFSGRIQHVLKTISAINATATTLQRSRILSITVAANIFFVIHFVIEGALALCLVLAWHAGQPFNSVLREAAWWEEYIIIKHWSEVVVLGLALFLSLTNGPAERRNDYERIPEAF